MPARWHSTICRSSEKGGGMPTGQDNSTRESGGPGKQPPLPTVLSLVARRVTETTPRRFVTQGKEYTTTDVIRIEVEMSDDFPIAGTGPALIIGQVALTDSERLRPRQY